MFDSLAVVNGDGEETTVFEDNDVVNQMPPMEVSSSTEKSQYP